MKLKHTKGEWFIEPEREISEFGVEGIDISSRKHITSMATVWNTKGDEIENEANAKLIAAAPKLLETLIEISEGKGRYSEDRLEHASNTIEDMIKLAKEAINKATE